MTREQMLVASKDVELLEKDLMRDLTEEESSLVINEGFEALFKKLDITNKDYKTIIALKKLLAAYLTESCERYESLVKVATPEMADVLHELTKDVDAALHVDDCCPKCKHNPCVCDALDQYKKEIQKINPIKLYIHDLKSGKELELSSDIINQIVDYLWETESNIKISVVNNKIKLY